MNRDYAVVLNTLRSSILVILSFCLIQPTSTQYDSCPAPCTCNIWRLGKEETVVNIYCQQRGLTAVPKEFSKLKRWNKIDKILLDGNSIRTLPRGAFSGLDVRTISFLGNPLTHVDSEAFAGTIGITDLNFNDCNLTSVPDIFNSTPEIQTIELNGNRITDIKKGVFEPVRNLRHIDIGNNKISNLNFLVDKCAYKKAFTGIILSNNPLKCTCDAYELAKSKTVQLVDGVCASPRKFRAMYIGTGNPMDDDEDGLEQFMDYASKSCSDACPDAQTVEYNCPLNIWTDGADLNCNERPLCVKNKLHCPEDAIAHVNRSEIILNGLHDTDDDDDDEDDDEISTNRTKYRKRPNYIIEKIGFSHSDKKGKRDTSSSSKNGVVIELIVMSALVSSIFMSVVRNIL